MEINNLLKKLNLYELIGIILGDGSIWNYPKKRVYGLEITGNADDEPEYFSKISNFIEKKIGKRPRIYVKEERLGKSLKLVVYSKEFVNYLIHELNIPYKNKTFNAFISDKFLDWKYSKHILRGLFETDGSLYFSSVRGVRSYPRIEIKTSSKMLAGQITTLLEQNLFKPHQRTNNSDKTIGVYISGPVMLEKWTKEIGFGSNKSLTKYLLWKKLGYYIPRTNLKERLNLLGVWPSG